MSEPIDRSTVWPYEGGEPGPFAYARHGSPTVAAAERALGALDGGEAVLFSSGAAASTAVFLALLGPGSTVALAVGCYYGTGRLLAELERWGLRHVEFDQRGPPPAEADLVWLEAPSNPFLTLPDFEAAAVAARRGALVACDATVATPLHVRPLERGCQLAVHSATKVLAGHDDALVGAVVCGEAAHAARLREFRTLTGAVPGPDAAWLLLRGLETLELRVARQTASARLLAERLAAHPAVGEVRYPGFGGLLSFDVADAGAARRVETSTRLIANMTSLGGVRSRIEARARWEGERVPGGLLRLSVGVEDPEALWADLEQALGRA
ncbi:MAG TPA: PLP-dependent aspartate aminotransferase family protein [Gaiellaceae bacterium]|nr:PLP-dependent aspartate aminotransferase family protein [Gaiellaceae bacterium]